MLGHGNGGLCSTCLFSGWSRKITTESAAKSRRELNNDHPEQRVSYSVIEHLQQYVASFFVCVVRVGMQWFCERTPAALYQHSALTILVRCHANCLATVVRYGFTARAAVLVDSGVSRQPAWLRCSSLTFICVLVALSAQGARLGVGYC